MPGFKGIRGKIISTYLILILISMAVAGISLIWMVQNYLLTSLEGNMAKQGRLIADLVAEPVSRGQYNELDARVDSLGKDINARITLVLNDGRVIADSHFDPVRMENHLSRSEIKEALEGQAGVNIRQSTTSEVETIYVAVPIRYENGIFGAARVALPLSEIDSTISRFRHLLLTCLLIATFIAVLLSIKLAKGFTEPIEHISTVARKIGKGDLNTRIFTGMPQDEIGELAQVINTMTKTLQQHIEDISQEKNRLENILYTMVSGVIMLDKYGMVRVVNPAAQEMFGINALMVEGKHNLEVIRHFGLNQEIERCIIEEKIIDYEFTLRLPVERVVQCYIAPVYRDKKISGITMVFHDITKLRKVEQMRADFVANASHELRTPLTIIKGYTETLLNGALDDRQIAEKFLNIMDQEAVRLQKLVDELLTLSQIESNKQEATEPLNIPKIINSTVTEMQSRFKEKEIDLEINLPEEMALAKGNGDRVKQVLVNLLDNALKYTPTGGSVVVSTQDLENKIKIIIKDTGIGIPEKDLPRLFERFYRVDKARGRQLGGFGLGLSIVKHMVEKMGGNIGVESEVKSGSTFWFTIPKNS